MPKTINRACVLPEDLYKKLVQALYQLYGWGVPMEDAAEVGKIVINNYWRDWLAEESG